MGEYYTVTFVGLYFSLTCQVNYDDCEAHEDKAIEYANDLMKDVYGWEVQECSHEVIVVAGDE
jgi:hypothetical protein